MEINSWESFVDAVYEYCRMNEDNSYLFEPKVKEKNQLRKQIQIAIKEHRKKVVEHAKKKQLSLFDDKNTP